MKHVIEGFAEELVKTAATLDPDELKKGMLWGMLQGLAIGSAPWMVQSKTGLPLSASPGRSAAVGMGTGALAGAILGLIRTMMVGKKNDRNV